jgi:hypothetical protein
MESTGIEYLEYLKTIEFFANEITPPTWNVFLDNKDYSFKAGTLNIWLEILDEEERSELGEETHEFIGRVTKPMKFFLISQCKVFQPEAARALKKYGDGIISSSRIQICPESDAELECTIVHELSHIAVARRKAQQLKAVKNNLSLMSHKIDGEDEHGPTFQKAYKRMILRTENIFGNDLTMAMWIDLAFYKRNVQITSP